MFAGLFTFSAAIAATPQTVIQTQPSSDGNFEIGLTEVKLKKDVLTVKAVLKNISGNKQKIDICYENIYFIDSADTKKYLALKDSEGATIAGPVDDFYPCKGGKLSRELAAGQQAIFWFKLPAPASGASEVDFFMPNFLPFEGVGIQP